MEELKEFYNIMKERVNFNKAMLDIYKGSYGKDNAVTREQVARWVESENLLDALDEFIKEKENN